jgi:hypothetical protein
LALKSLSADLASRISKYALNTATERSRLVYPGGFVKSRDCPGPFLAPVSASRAGGGTSGILTPSLGSSLGPQPTTKPDRNKTEQDKMIVHFVFVVFFITNNSGKKI